MAVNNPLLAAWDTTGVVRMFEYVGGAFVQIGSIGGYTHVNSTPTFGGPEFPFLRWMGNDAACLLVREASANLCTATALSPTGVALENINIGLGTSQGLFRAAAGGRKFVDIQRNAYVTAGNTFQINMTGTGDISSVATDSLAAQRVKVWSFSPDASKTFWKDTFGVSVFKTMNGAINDVPVAYDTVGDPGFLLDVDLAEWAYDNKTLVIADKDSSRVQSWVYEDDVWQFVHELVIPVGIPQAIAMSPDKRKMAVSTLDGGTYRTKIYRRTGSFFIAEQEFSGFGRLLGFTEDGVLLVDCASQVAYEKQPDESLALSATAMTNIPAGIRSQALSEGRTDPYGTATLYDAAVAEFADETANLANLKITLLDSAASFNSADTTFAEATNSGAWELSSGGWPAGGVLLTGVTSASGAGYFSLSCDQVSRVLIETGVAFRYAVIYDATSGKPLIFIDLISERAYAKSRELLIDFRGGEFLRFSK